MGGGWCMLCWPAVQWPGNVSMHGYRGGLPVSASLLSADGGVGLQAHECIPHSQPETFLCWHLLSAKGGCPGCSEQLSSIVAVG